MFLLPIPVIDLYPVTIEAAQPGDAFAAARSNGTSLHPGKMTKWDLCIGSTGRAQRPEVLRSNPIPN
jgi:hypothetical protein